MILVTGYATVHTAVCTVVYPVVVSLVFELGVKVQTLTLTSICVFLHGRSQFSFRFCLEQRQSPHLNSQNPMLLVVFWEVL